MRIIIAGSRNATQSQVRAAHDQCPWSGFASSVVSGTAQGADRIGESIATEQGIPVVRWPADWEKHGRRAGPIRNREMAKNAEGLIAVWDGKSRGTGNMISTAKEQGLRIFVFATDRGVSTEISPTGQLADSWEIAEERAAVLEFEGGETRETAENIAGRETCSFAP